VLSPVKTLNIIVETYCCLHTGVPCNTVFVWNSQTVWSLSTYTTCNWLYWHSCNCAVKNGSGLHEQTIL